MRPVLRWPLRPFTLALVVSLSAGVTHAQVELVDPDAPSVRKQPPKKKAPPPPSEVEDVDPSDTTAPEPVDEPEVRKPIPAVKDAAKDAGKDVTANKDVVVSPLTRDAGSPEPKPVEVKAPPKKDKDVKPAAIIVVRPTSDAELDHAWQDWKKVEAGHDVDAEKKARARLVSLKNSIGASNMDTWAMGLLRVSAGHEARGDSGGAVEIALTAVELAPKLPSAWVGLARAHFQADPSGVGRYLSALGNALALIPGDPRYSQPALADLSAMLLLALLLTVIGVVGVLFVRRAFYFFYDFHFFFPRSASRWQTSALALLLLSLPLVFRMGVAPALLAFFAAATLYLTQAERVVSAVLIASLGLVPMIGGLVVEHTAFAGTTAEDLDAMERGGAGVEPLAQKYETLATEDKVGFAEHFVLGRLHLRRGRLEQAQQHFRKALALTPEHVGARVNLGVTFFLAGDLENSRSVLEGVARDSHDPVALFDLGRLYQQRVSMFGDQVTGEVDKFLGAFAEAGQRDPSLPRISADERLTGTIDGVTLTRTVPLERSAVMAQAHGTDAAERVRSQLSLMLLGDLPGEFAPFFPLLMALLLLGLGQLSRTLETARECNKCGNPVSHRGDPDVSPGSQMCTQCVNVFAKKNVVAPSLKVRKQLEIARYQSRIERTGLVLGAVFSGMGHVFSGLPVRGAIYGFLFAFGVAGVALRNGVLRTPFEPIPIFVRLLPVMLLAVAVYLVSLRALRRKQG
jgi:Flp pilus assembly protein TadD